MWKDTHPAKQKGHSGQKILTLLAEATIKAAAKDKVYDFYFQNKDLELVAHELLCRLSCYRSFTLSYNCNFLKAPLINFEEVLNHPLPTALLKVH